MILENLSILYLGLPGVKENNIYRFYSKANTNRRAHRSERAKAVICVFQYHVVLEKFNVNTATFN